MAIGDNLGVNKFQVTRKKKPAGQPKSGSGSDKLKPGSQFPGFSDEVTLNEPKTLVEDKGIFKKTEVQTETRDVTFPATEDREETTQPLETPVKKRVEFKNGTVIESNQTKITVQDKNGLLTQFDGFLTVPGENEPQMGGLGGMMGGYGSTREPKKAENVIIQAGSTRQEIRPDGSSKVTNQSEWVMPTTEEGAKKVREAQFANAMNPMGAIIGGFAGVAMGAMGTGMAKMDEYEIGTSGKVEGSQMKPGGETARITPHLILSSDIQPQAVEGKLVDGGSAIEAPDKTTLLQGQTKRTELPVNPNWVQS